MAISFNLGGTILYYIFCIKPNVVTVEHSDRFVVVGVLLPNLWLCIKEWSVEEDDAHSSSLSDPLATISSKSTSTSGSCFIGSAIGSEAII